MTDHKTALVEAKARIEELSERLREAEETIRAIRMGEVDAVVVGETESPQVFTLRGADHTYRVMVEQMNEAAASATRDGILLFCNARFADLVGRTRESLIASPVENLISEGDRPEFRRLFSQALLDRAQGELSARGPSGLVPTYASMNSLTIEGERVVCMLLTDLTEHRRNEEIVAAGRLATAILEQIGEATVVCDPRGKILRTSRATGRLCGCEAVGRSFAEVFPLQPESGEPFVLSAVRPDGPIVFTARLANLEPAVGRTHVLVNARALVNDEGAHLGWVVSLADITAQKDLERELRRAREAAESAARAKGDFLANMSHEIRTPMNAVIGFTDLLLATSLTDEQRRFLDLVKSSGEALLDVVNDVLDLSKIEAGKFEFIDEPFDLRDLTERVTRSLGLRAHQKGLELTGHVPFSTPTALIGDPGRLRQVLVNLIGNAVKFTDQGEVHLSVQEVEPPRPRTNGEPLWLRFSVRDTGIGIAPEDLQLLFQSFQQVDSSSTRRHEGSGLGLFISRLIVEQMGGTIQARSEVGKGTTFSFTVPFRVQQGLIAATAEGQLVPELRGQKVLVVDDNETNRMIVLEMLTNQEMEVSVAGSGQEALGLLRSASGARRPYELLIVDCQMPGMDGFHLIERVKSDLKLPQPVILMLTSDDLPAYCGRAKQVGAAGYLVKPVSCAELLVAVRTVLGNQPPKGAEAALVSPEEPCLEPEECLRVLLAEDNAVNQVLVRALIERKGWSITVVEDGRTALETLARETVDVVLMDVQMPLLDGYETTRALRDMERASGGDVRRTPVIGLTAHALREDRQRCLQAGMDDYLAKPVEAHDLYEAIRRNVRRARNTT
ncbi:MAG: response regulator [Deltaproteobacteria bacterium]|nr:response regulator [Deltaproteobacteria bacterium]